MLLARPQKPAPEAKTKSELTPETVPFFARPMVRRVFFLLTCFQAYVSASAASMVLGSALQSSGSLRAAMFVLAAAYASGSIVNAAAAWRLHQGKTHWIWAASLLNLIVVPLGTLFGVAGFFLMTRKEFRASCVAPANLRAQQADRTETPTSRQAATRSWAALAPLVAAVPLVLLSWTWAASLGLPTQSAWQWAINAELALVVCALFHECGHLLCGWLSDFRLTRFTAGPLCLTKRSGKWSARLAPAGLIGAGAHCAMVPTHSRRLSSRTFFFTAGGPLGSLAAAITGTIGFLTAAHSPWSAAWPFFQLMMALGAAQALVNLIPAASLGACSDFARHHQQRGQSSPKSAQLTSAPTLKAA